MEKLELSWRNSVDRVKYLERACWYGFIRCLTYFPERIPEDSPLSKSIRDELVRTTLTSLLSKARVVGGEAALELDPIETMGVTDSGTAEAWCQRGALEEKYVLTKRERSWNGKLMCILH